MESHSPALKWSSILVGIAIMFGLGMLAPLFLIAIGVGENANIIGLLIGLGFGCWYAGYTAPNRPFLHAILVPVVYYAVMLVFIGVASLFV